jgi:hypothetical protein
MKRWIWTVGLMFIGIFLTFKSPPSQRDKLIPFGAFFGAVIGFGFGSIFTCKNSRIAILYWAMTLATIGAVIGLREPILASRVLTCLGWGLLTGAVVGFLVHAFQNRNSIRDAGNLPGQNNPRA